MKDIRKEIYSEKLYGYGAGRYMRQYMMHVATTILDGAHYYYDKVGRIKKVEDAHGISAIYR